MITKIFKFSTSWCGPCKSLAKELKDFTDVPIISYDADEREDLCELYNIRNVPTLIFLNEKEEEVGRNFGFISKNDLIEKIKNINENN